jgi:ketosteroid isomerase-like protein
MGETERSALLRTNAAFYRAFAERDIEAMDELWAHATPVVCIHPGWPALHGREDVLSSWRAILLGGEAPDIRCEQAVALLIGEVGLVTCVERIGNDALVATNVFAREQGLWQIVHHQAGPVSAPDPIGPDTPLN